MGERQSLYEAVLGPLDETMSLNEQLAAAMGYLTDSPWSAEDYDRELHRLQSVMVQEKRRQEAAGNHSRFISRNLMVASRQDANRATAINDVQALLLHSEVSCNVLTDWPATERLLSENGHTAPGGNALLVGAISSLSARAFAVLSKQTFKTATAHIIDIEGCQDMTHHGNFVQADALHLPYAAASMDVVQTSQLFGLLEDPSGKYPTSEERMGRFMREACRVLRPGGQLIMRERFEDMDAQDAQFSLLEHIAVEEEMDRIVIQTYLRHADHDVVFDPDRAYENYGLVHDLSTFAIYACMPDAA